MDIDNFVEKQEATVNKYQRIYKILDFSAIVFTFFSIMWILNIDKWIFTLRTFELYESESYNFVLITVSIGTIAIMLLSVIFASIITVLLHIKDEKVNIIRLLEIKYPELNEKLRTASDNKNNDNIIVNDLRETVIEATSKIGNFTLESRKKSKDATNSSLNAVKVNKSNKNKKSLNSQYSKFLSKKKFTINVVLLIITFSTFSFVTATDVRSDITPEEINNFIEKIPFIPSAENGTSPDEQFPLEGDAGENSEDLVGETAIIVVGGEEVDLSLPPGAGTGFTDSGDEDSLPPEFESSSAYEVGRISSPAYYEQLPEGYESIIKEYFEQMASNR
ncbi:DUF7502 family protein [Methanococcoides seepicolus]|uniref:Uncharacterized protein n=1 Tax=Methanococcoides seepicolus TaxID=2828780 RepID=A0A9E4ZEX5_9EURY|nr:hypothetical protein [Methanococcoides seepicolus]MCM1985913.1 hypothetical protein [Methanococcoides seepicolus]